MLLLDSIYINNSGGLVLLKYLVETLEAQNIDVFYLFDERTKSTFQYIDSDRKAFLPNSFLKRLNFYHENKNKFNSVLCFGNLPPPIKLDAKVAVYFHQLLFLEIPNNFSKKNKAIYLAKQFILKSISKNADYWVVQSSLIQNKLAKMYVKDRIERVRIIPFYPPLDFKNENNKKVKSQFLYVSNVVPHKNHQRLIYAFCEAFDKTKKGKLILTIPQLAKNIIALIEEKRRQGYPIENIGFVNREKLANCYKQSEYVIFPSLTESFGLGLAEAIDGGCKVIGADLPYTYQVCEPSLTFDPNSRADIANAIIRAVTEELPPTKKIIENDINKLISLIVS